MKRVKVITSNAELEEFLAKTNIEIINVDVRSCEQSWFAQEYFTAVIYYDDEPKSEYDPDYWTRLEHQAAIAAMQGILSNPEYLRSLMHTKHNDYRAHEVVPNVAVRLAHTLVEKMKEEK